MYLETKGGSHMVEYLKEVLTRVPDEKYNDETYYLLTNKDIVKIIESLMKDEVIANKYLASEGDSVQFEDSLTDEEKQAGLSMVFLTFSYWSNDLESISKTILKG